MNYALSTTVCSNKIILEGEIKYSRMRRFFYLFSKISLIVLITVVFNCELLMRLRNLRRNVPNQYEARV